MSWLDSAFTLGPKVLQSAGVALANERVLNFLSGFTAVDNPTSGRIDVSVGGSSGGAPVVPWTQLTAAATLTNAQSYVDANTSAGAFTITMPTSPADGQMHRFTDVSQTWGTNNVTLARSGSQQLWNPNNPGALLASVVLSITGGSIDYVYNARRSVWVEV